MQEPAVSKRAVTISGHAVRFQVVGQGEPVVLVHGLAGSSGWWARNIPVLSTRQPAGRAADDLACRARAARGRRAGPLAQDHGADTLGLGRARHAGTAVGRIAMGDRPDCATPQVPATMLRRQQIMSPQIPLLVLVSGAPASGKTVLAERLAATLRLPLLSRDEIKEALYDTLGAPDSERSRQLASPSYVVLYTILKRLLAAGVGAVVESNFHRGLSERNLQPVVAHARTVLVHCQTTREEIARRYAERTERGERHPGHHDSVLLHRVLADLDAGTFEPLDLEIPLLRVDTTAEYAPDFDTIRDFALSALRAHPS